MGNCFADTSEEAVQDAHIQKQMKQDKKEYDAVIKLLLLGTGESGKSTIFKQMKIIHNKGYDTDECKRFKDVIYGNMLLNIHALVTAMPRLKLTYEKPENAAYAAEIAALPATVAVSPSLVLTQELFQKIKSIWNDAGIQKCFERRAEYQLNDSAEYYFKNIDRISNTKYAPDQQDVLRSRVKTIGIIEADFKIDGYRFKMVDVGGQRNERRKWIHAFDDVTAIIFVTSLSEYDQKLLEDEDVFRMHESLNLFEEICTCKFFRNTPIIVFLNKRDLFDEKIKVKDLTVCFPEYTGGKNYNKGIEFVTDKFLEKNKNKNRQLFVNPTCATDTENVRYVFNSVKHIFLTANIENFS